MNNHFVVYSLLSLLFISPRLFSQLTQPAFRHYTTADGLPSPEVYEVLQDRRGYLWFGTDHGVSRFNGYEFENFGAAQGLRDNVIFYLHEDPRGRIWMVSMNERLYFYDYEQDSILTYAHNALIEPYVRRRNGPLGFFVDSTGAVYRSLDYGGVLKIDPSGSTNLLPGEAWAGPGIFELSNHYFFSLGAVYYGDIQQLEYFPMLYSNGYAQKQFSLPNLPEPGLGRGCILALKDHALFVYHRNFCVFRNGELSWTRPEPSFWVVSAWQDHRGKIYLGSIGKGVRIYKDEGHMRQDKYDTLLDDYTVSHILQDREGGFWFTTTQDGVFYAPALHFNLIDEASGLPEHNIVDLEVGHSDSIWLATHHGRLILLNTDQNKITEIDWNEDNSSHVRIFEIQKASNGSLWLATGLGTYEMKPSGTFSRLPILNPLKYAGYSKRLFFSRKIPDQLYSINPQLLTKLNLRTPDSLLFSSMEQGFSKRINTVFEDHKEQLWIGTTDGLYLLQGDSTIVSVRHHPNLALRIEAITELKDSTLVVGTKGAGLLLWKRHTFQEVGVEQGLVSGMVENLHVDSAQNIWVGTLEGISKLNPESKVTNYTVKDGLPSNEVMAIDSYGRRVWAATRRGLIEIKDKTFSRSRPPIFEELRVNREKYPSHEIWELPYRRNNIQIRFLTLDYAQAGHIRYRYRLQAAAPWNYTSNRTIDFSALHWGEYRFETQSQSKDGIWSASTLLPFSIRPPFWMSGWFWLLCTSGISAAAYGYYRRRIRYFQRQMTTQKQIDELQASAMRAQMNPHFIFNCLNSIQSFIASGDKIEATRYLARFARLVRGALQASLESRIPLEEEISILENYLALEQMRFDRRFCYNIEVDDRIDRCRTKIPPMLVQPFVENSIVHGLEGAARDGQINIFYQFLNGRLQVIVEDNGIGITAAQKNKNGRPSINKSVGITLTRRRLELLDRFLQDESVKICELEESGKVIGTKVVINVPV